MLADCPDCGRVELHRNRCPVCGGDSWQRAGGVAKQFVHHLPWLKRMRLVAPMNKLNGAVHRYFGKRAGGR
jgi:hypothetical protein